MQVYMTVMNSAWRKPAMMPTFIGCMIFAEIASLYIMITSVNHLPITVFAFFFMVANEVSTVIHVVFKSLSTPYTKSTQFVNEVLRRDKREISKWTNKFLKSCSPCKILMGDGSHFNSISSLIIWQFCVEMLITLLLL